LRPEGFDSRWSYTKKTKLKDIFLDVFFLCLKKQKESNREVSAPTGGKVPRMAPNNLAKA
ncbi:MAG: hypothetical protein PUD00_03240, partial [Treponema berlinense]|uniref:hypothetical protein n=1 Tax=Treponema berlinense TaxID=225004 RepID=UPI0023F50ACE